jgi:hypothetical protein
MRLAAGRSLPGLRQGAILLYVSCVHDSASLGKWPVEVSCPQTSSHATGIQRGLCGMCPLVSCNTLKGSCLVCVSGTHTLLCLFFLAGECPSGKGSDKL